MILLHAARGNELRFGKRAEPLRPIEIVKPAGRDKPARLAEFAARYEGGRLPDVLVPEREEPALGVTVFRVAVPGEIAAIAAFCALDAPPSMTGAVLDANGASYVR